VPLVLSKALTSTFPSKFPQVHPSSPKFTQVLNTSVPSTVTYIKVNIVLLSLSTMDT